MKTIEEYSKEIITQQQEDGVCAYLEEAESGSDMLPFWRWYRFWCAEEGLFDDTTSTQRDVEDGAE